MECILASLWLQGLSSQYAMERRVGVVGFVGFVLMSKGVFEVNAVLIWICSSDLV